MSNVEVCSGYFEYNMSPLMAEMILKERKGDDKKKHPQQYLCDYVNSEFGIKGICVKVTTTAGSGEY